MKKTDVYMNHIRINRSFNSYCSQIKDGTITLAWLESNCDWTLSFFTGKQLERLKRLQKKSYYKGKMKRNAYYDNLYSDLHKTVPEFMNLKGGSKYEF